MYQGRKGTKSGRTGYIEILNAAPTGMVPFTSFQTSYIQRENVGVTQEVVGLMVGIMADLVVGLVVRSEDERHGEH